MKIRLHKNLDRKIWDKNEQINPNVSDMLLSIAWAYIDYVRNEYDMPIRNCDIKDIFVFGSTTQLFHDRKSDMDVCIVLDIDYVKQKFPNLDIETQLKLYFYDWAMVHVCKIYGHKIDLNFQNEKTPEYNGRYRRGPIYSLLNKEWILKPIALSKDELKKLERQATIIYKKIIHDYNIVKKNGFKLNEIKQLYSNIQASKKYSLANNCEQIMTPTYMAIWQVKHKGYIKKLRDKAIKKETEKYVLK